MKLKEIVDRAEDYDKENLTELNPTFYTEAETEAIQNALKQVSAACIQSGMRLVKIHQTDTKEFIVLNAEDGEATAIQSLTKELLENVEDVELGSDNTDPNTLFVVADLPEELQPLKKPEEETEEDN